MKFIESSLSIRQGDVSPGHLLVVYIEAAARPPKPGRLDRILFDFVQCKKQALFLPQPLLLWRLNQYRYYCWGTTRLAKQLFFRKSSQAHDRWPAWLTAVGRRISQGHSNLTGPRPIARLKDIDQPFIFEISFGRRQYRLEFYDTASPENWRLLQPDLVIVCYDISQRPSLTNLQRRVCAPGPSPTARFSATNACLVPQWIKEVRATFSAESTLPLAVLGLKRDLRSEDDPSGPIYPQEGYRVAQELRADKYMECSAVTGELLPLTFEEICTMAVKTRTAEGGQSDGGCCIM